jgi:phosphoribosylformylglycinamidine synthase
VKVGIVVFPGSNCDHDCYEAVKATEGLKPEFIWHRETDLNEIDIIILPGGFSYGDYLRAGAIARFSPVMKSIQEFAYRGGYVFGICNGFQMLTEAGLLPGTLRMNVGLRFICREIRLRTEKNDTFVTSGIATEQILILPIAHKMGNYYADNETLARLEGEGRVVFRYCNESGEIITEANPNGSLNNIAGICDKSGRIVGMMPHPERRINRFLGGEDGKLLFNSMAQMFMEI